MGVARSRKPLTEERLPAPGARHNPTRWWLQSEFRAQPDFSIITAGEDVLNGEALTGIGDLQLRSLGSDLLGQSRSTVCNDRNPNLTIPLPALEVKCICTVPKAIRDRSWLYN